MALGKKWGYEKVPIMIPGERTAFFTHKILNPICVAETALYLSEKSPFVSVAIFLKK